jgi:hypothetical protein
MGGKITKGLFSDKRRKQKSEAKVESRTEHIYVYIYLYDCLGANKCFNLSPITIEPVKTQNQTNEYNEGG